MPNHGRRDNPTEHNIGDVIGQRHVLDRTIRAQVRSVDAENGFVILIYENMPGGGKYTTIQPLWMSFPDPKIGNPAWGRFIPQEGDLVRVSFDYDDRPVIVGHDISAESAKIADGLSGWPALNEQYKISKGANAPTSKAKFAQFIPLKPGEYDFMSTGGAYIYGNNQGRLYLAGGNVSVTLIKNDLRISQRSQLISHSADNCEYRFGQVRRTDTATQLDKIVSSDTNGVYKEFSVVLKRTVDAQTSMDVSTFKIGNVVDDSGSVTGPSNPYRFLYQAFGSSGSEVCKMAIDNLGNWDVLAPDNATTGVTFDFSKGDWVTKFKTATHTNSSKTSIDSPNVNLGAVDAPEHLILGNTYGNAEKEYVSDMATQVQNAITSLKNVNTALNTFALAINTATLPAVSLPTIITAMKGIGAAATALQISVAPEIPNDAEISTEVGQVASTFTDAYDTYLSKISKTQ